MVDYILRCAIPDDSHGFIISPRVGTQSRTSSTAVAVSDLDFALLSHNHADAQALLTSMHAGLLCRREGQWFIKPWQDHQVKGAQIHINENIPPSRTLNQPSTLEKILHVPTPPAAKMTTHKKGARVLTSEECMLEAQTKGDKKSRKKVIGWRGLRSGKGTQKRN